MLNAFTLPIRIVQNPKQIVNIRHTPLKHLIGSALIWYLIFAAIASGLISVLIAPNALEFAHSLAQDIKDNFPPNATISIQSGNLQINGYQPPLVIPLSQKPQAISANNLAIIDPNSPAETISQKDSLMLFSQKALATQPSPNYQPRITPYNDLTADISLNYQDIVNEANLIQASIQQIKPWLFPLIFIGLSLAIVSARAIFLLIYALLIQSISMIAARPLTYIDSLKIGAVSLIFSELINLIQIALYQSSFPFIFTLAFIGISAILILNLPKTARANS